MTSKHFTAYIGLLTGSMLTLTATPAKAFNFTRGYTTAADVLDFTSLGYTYDYGYNNNFDTLPASAAATTGLTVRKNAVEMTQAESADFINAILTLKNTFTTTDNGVSISVYDQFVAVHVANADAVGRPGPDGNSMVDPAHGGSAFTAWHRALLYEFEQALQSVNPDVFVPYWNWTDAATTQNILFQDSFMGPNGTPDNNNAVMSGYFSQANGWVGRADLTGRWRGVNNRTQPLTRRLGSFSNLGTVTNVNAALNQANYADFRLRLQGGTGLHNSTHGWVGGTMGNVAASPNDPLFWMLHANVDRIWAEWQVSGHWGNSFYPSSGMSYGHNLNDPMFPWNSGEFVVATDLQDLLPGLPNTINGSVLVGNSTISGDYYNSGVVSPGNSPGIVNILGDYVQDTLGELTIEIAGLNAGTDYDLLNITGTAFLDGTLNLYFLEDFIPNAGDTFSFLSASKIVGSFPTINIFGLDNPYDFDLEIKGNTLLLTTLGFAHPSAASHGFAKTPEALLVDTSGHLYNPRFGQDADYYCYGEDQHHGWGDKTLQAMDHSIGHGAGSTVYLPLNIDETQLCNRILSHETHSNPTEEHVHHNHGEGHHNCPLGMNCHGCHGNSCPLHNTHCEPQSVPEPASVFALIALGAVGVSSQLRKKDT
jgi:tyrosinase